MDALTVIAEPKRRDILRLVWSEPMTAGEIAGHFDVTFGAVSQHLGVLRDAGFVSVRKDGRRRYYATDHVGLGPLRDMLEAMWSDTLDRLDQVIREDGHG